ncbi:MAG: ROK family protein, partial [Actinomycetota bacterium]
MDVGGTKIRAARVEADGRLTDEATWPTPGGDGRAVLESIAAMIHERVAGRALQRVGLAMPGGIDPSSGRLLRSQNLPDLAELDVPGDLARRVAAPVSIDNDGTLAAIGERSQGAARGVDDLAVIAVGTGVGAGIITGGRPLRGARGLAGELA